MTRPSPTQQKQQQALLEHQHIDCSVTRTRKVVVPILRKGHLIFGKKFVRQKERVNTISVLNYPPSLPFVPKKTNPTHLRTFPFFLYTRST